VKAPLGRLGLWDSFLSQSPVRSSAVLSIWGNDRLQEQSHFYNPYGAGWHVDRRQFDLMLACHARDAGVELITKAQVVPCENRDFAGWTIHFRTGETCSSLRARIVLNASGRSSAIGRQCGARRVLYDRLVGVIGFFARAEHPQQVTLVEAMEDGWWYSAPLPDSRLVVAWMTDADLYARGGRHCSKRWLAELSRASHTLERSRGAWLVSPPWIVPANSSRLDRMHGANWLAIGDAAMAFDPLSGQGVFQALESGIKAAGAVQAFLGGAVDEPAAYGARLSGGFDKFLALRCRYYGQETRWPASSFWRRRHVYTSHEDRPDAGLRVSVDAVA
jgi:flavin-dependent dehydrogenase